MLELKEYSITNDIAGGEINYDKLQDEILNSGYVSGFIALHYLGNSDKFTVIGEEILDEASLDVLVNEHQLLSLQDLKNKRYQEIDNHTGELILAGFTFDSFVFSMSINAQINWSNFPNLPDSLFPLNIVSKYETIYVLALENKTNFYLSALNHKSTQLQSGGALKIQITNCTTEHDVNLIIDNR